MRRKTPLAAAAAVALWTAWRVHQRQRQAAAPPVQPALPPAAPPLAVPAPAHVTPSPAIQASDPDPDPLTVPSWVQPTLASPSPPPSPPPPQYRPPYRPAYTGGYPPGYPVVRAKPIRTGWIGLMAGCLTIGLWAAWLMYQGLGATAPPAPSDAALSAPVGNELVAQPGIDPIPEPAVTTQAAAIPAPSPTSADTATASTTPTSSPEPAPSGVPTTTAPTDRPVRISGPNPLSFSKPQRLVVPALRINAALTSVGITSDGHLGVPPVDQPRLAGWYQRGVSPGQQGTALILGHVDTKQGPAVFYGLAALKPADTIEVTRADGTIATFTVDGVRVYSKADFPARKVLAPTGRPELRLVTCGGPYSKETGYTSNVVIYAHYTGSKRVAETEPDGPDA
ncbi:MAG: class F sortase [Sporichthyaceae bacterium]|nr:class F sortase [Sporichthyaceae bacterium]